MPHGATPTHFYPSHFEKEGIFMGLKLEEMVQYDENHNQITFCFLLRFSFIFT